MIVGKGSGGGAYAVTLPEAVEQLNRLTGGAEGFKEGVKSKVEEVVQRRCTVNKDGYLEWIY